MNVDLLRPLLVAADDRGITAALDRYDAAMSALTEATRGRRHKGDRRRDAQAALDAEHTAAAIEGRASALDASTLTAADEADAEQAARLGAAQRVITVREAELASVVEGAWTALLPLCAAERAAASRRGDPDVSASVLDLWPSFRWPAIAYRPAHVRKSSTDWLREWWPIPVTLAPTTTTVPGEAVDLWRHWVEFVWQELARKPGKGWTVLDDGRLQLRNVWQPPAELPAAETRKRKGIVVAAMVTGWPVPEPTGPVRSEPGDVVMLGTGPNCEHGVDPDDVNPARGLITFRPF